MTGPEPLTADLAAVVDQTHALLGPPIAALGALSLPTAGWLFGAWAHADGQLDELAALDVAADLRLAWLSASGSLQWLAAQRGAVIADATITADTPRSFHGCVCEQADVGAEVWERAVLRVPLLAACPLGFDAWSERAPRRTHAGGPALLIDPAARALDEALAAELRRAGDPRRARAEQTWFSWSTDDDTYRVPGLFAATATERSYPPGSIIPTDAIKHFLFVSTLGTWLSYTSNPDGSSTIREFDTVRDLYRFAVAGRPDGDVVRAMWANLTARHPLARTAESAAR